MTAGAKTEQTHNPWSYYYAETVGFEADRFSVKRRIEFMESPHTRAVWVKQPVGADYVEVTVRGECHDAELGKDVGCQFSFFFYADVLEEGQKRRVLEEIGRRYPGSTLNHLKPKREAAKALGMRRFFG